MIIIKASGHWFGARDEDNEGTWRWETDGQLMSNWSMIMDATPYTWVPPGYPYNSFTSNCLYWDINTGKFMDYNCGPGFYYMCEHPRTIFDFTFP